jgi:hypothetical protein
MEANTPPVLERELDETEFPSLEKTRPHALEVAKEAHAPPEARSEDAEAVTKGPCRAARLALAYLTSHHASRWSSRSSFVAFFHSL